MTRKARGEKRVGKTEDQLGLPHARAVSDEAIREINDILQADRGLETVKEIAKTVPDGIIRAYRKAIRIKEECPHINDNTDEIEGWADGVMWELTQLYPDLNKLPKEE